MRQDRIAIRLVRTLRPLALLTALAGVLFAPASADSQEARVQKVSGLAGSCQLVPVDTVQFEDGGRRGWYLYVGGMRRFANMDVGLEHRGMIKGALTIEVVGCTGNFIALPIATPYYVELPLRDVPPAKTIRIVGADGVTLHRVPGR
jgi:hypothetical protein